MGLSTTNANSPVACNRLRSEPSSVSKASLNVFLVLIWPLKKGRLILISIIQAGTTHGFTYFSLAGAMDTQAKFFASAICFLAFVHHVVYYNTEVIPWL